MSKAALIIGGNAASLQAALDLAGAGIKVHLVESSPFLGNFWETTLPKYIHNTRILEAARHPNVQIWTNTRLNRAEGKPGSFNVELRQHPRYVDLSRCTACGECITVCPVTVPGTQHKVIHLDGQPQCMAIDKLGKAPCANTCPGGIHVQGYVALIAQGRFQEAIDLIREAIPFPGICGRVCTHPCEVNCRRAEVDSPVAVRLLKRFVSDWEINQGKKVDEAEEAYDKKKPAKNSRRVAIIGAGPGGMSVADRLVRLGYQVTVFEKLPVIGGMLAVGIPEYRLPREIIRREYQQILDQGVDIRLNTTVGPGGDLTLDDLFEKGYEAICLAIGAHRSQALNIPGEDMGGVIHGIELLKMINLSQSVDEDVIKQSGEYRHQIEKLIRKGRETRVGILGGGNTAMDVARSLKRLGLKDVRILYRRTLKEMPAMPEEIEDTKQEGVEIEFLVSPVRVLGDERGRVTGLECIRMKLGEPDSSGRRRPVPIAGSEFVENLDLVVLAIGQAPDFHCLEGSQSIAVTRDERINVTEPSFMTSRKGVFAVGDAVTSDKMVVIEAIGMGKKAASAIDSYLTKQQWEEVSIDSREAPIARREMAASELVPKSRTKVPTISMEERVSNFSEVELGFTEEQATTEAKRCLACGPCSECLACEKVCKPGAIMHHQRESYVELDIGAILAEEDQLSGGNLSLVKDYLFSYSPCDALQGSASAAKAMLDLDFQLTKSRQVHYPSKMPVEKESSRVGVFVCQCGGEISSVIDHTQVLASMSVRPEVVCIKELPFSCSPEAIQDIRDDVDTYSLSHIVLGACSCCTSDQVCYSCTYQRIRCKQNLGIFGSTDSLVDSLDHRVQLSLVNIREQCAWVHADDPRAATQKTIALMGAAVARARGLVGGYSQPQIGERSVIILGRGYTGKVCQRLLASLGIPTQRVEATPEQVVRTGGHYMVMKDGETWQASGLVIAPEDDQEWQAISNAFGQEKYHPRIDLVRDGLETHRPGVIFCSPEIESEVMGSAAAVRMIAWLRKTEVQIQVAWSVDPIRCRACGDCVEICEYGAASLIEVDQRLTSWIDPMICTGCGVCAAHCPSGAISHRGISDNQIEIMLEAVFSDSIKVSENGSNEKF